MEIATLPPITIVPEVLKKDNYERWSILIKHYLVAQDVWDVVEPRPTTEETNERVWTQKDALALHAIKISCGAKAFDLIKNKESARDAWKALRDMPKVSVYHDIARRHEFVSPDIATPDQRGSDRGRILKSALDVSITAGEEDIALIRYGRIDPQEFLRGDYGFLLLEECITKKMFKIALDLLKRFPDLATNEPPQDCMPIILTLAKTPAPFFGGSQLNFVRLWIDDQQTDDLKSRDECAREVLNFLCQQLQRLDHNQFVQNRAVEAIFLAIKNGSPEIAIAIAKAKEDILWTTTDPEDSRTLFAYAIAHRQEEVAKFLYESKADKFYETDNDGNNNLHVAAKLAPQFQLDHITGAALQLQSELCWFKSVEAIVPRFFDEQKNNDGETPYQVFVKEHKNLLKEAEEWMKKTAESSTVLGALIITIVFAAAFTVPGGNDQNTGFPLFLNTTAPAESFTVTPFKVFIISDAISLFTAASSVLIFLGIHTSRYAYGDFLISLPNRLSYGLSLLFISIVTMTVAFCATIYVMLRGQQKEVIPVIVLAGILILWRLKYYFPLLENDALTPRPNIFDRKTATVKLVGLIAVNADPTVVNVVITGLIRLIRLIRR